MFSDVLKKRTLSVHMGLEKKLVARIRNIRTITDYTDLLKLMYGYYKPLQDRVHPHIEDFLISNGSDTRKAENILSDLAELAGKDCTDIPVCCKLPQVETQASSLGALYVTEGSTLGGQIITQMITKQLGIGDRVGFSFFNAYGADTLYRWQNLKSIINRSRNEQEENEMIDTAVATFSTFNDWLSDNERN